MSPCPAEMNCLRPWRIQQPSWRGVRSRLRLGHRDRAHDLALREQRKVARLLLVGAEAVDECRWRVPTDPVLDLRREVRAREHLADHHHDGEGQPRSAELDGHRRRCQPKLGKAT